MDVEFYIRGSWTQDGAGVKLYRVFGDPLAEITDPLLLDHFGSRYPHEYLAGFTWHPHRGIYTVTYLLKGEVRHENSEGNSGVLRPGGSAMDERRLGIFHSEMPRSFGRIPRCRASSCGLTYPGGRRFRIPSTKT